MDRRKREYVGSFESDTLLHLSQGLKAEWQLCLSCLIKITADFNKINEELEKLKNKEDVSDLIHRAASTKRMKERHEAMCLKAEKEYYAVLDDISNLAANNRSARVWGEKRTESDLKMYIELLELLDIEDEKKGGYAALSPLFYLKGDGALLNEALINFGISFLEKRGYISMQSQRNDYMVQLAQFVNDPNTVASDDWMNPSQLPIRYTEPTSGFSKITGLNESFDRVQQFCLTEPIHEYSVVMQEEMLKNSEEFYQMLNLPYKVVSTRSGKKYNMRAWFPGCNDYMDYVSFDNCDDHQSRKFEIRYREEKEKPKQYVHLLNYTLTKTEKTVLCILENYQREDGVEIPKVLREFMGGRSFIPFQTAKSRNVNIKDI